MCVCVCVCVCVCERDGERARVFVILYTHVAAKFFFKKSVLPRKILSDDISAVKGGIGATNQ